MKRLCLLFTLAATTVLTTSCGSGDVPPDCETFVVCGGTLAGTSWTFDEGCGDIQSVPMSITFNTNGTYTTENGTFNYTVQSDTVTLSLPGASPMPVTSNFCISGGLLGLQATGDPTTDYVLYQQKKN